MKRSKIKKPQPTPPEVRDDVLEPRSSGKPSSSPPVPLVVSKVANGVRYVLSLNPQSGSTGRRWIVLEIFVGESPYKGILIDTAALDGLITGLIEARDLLPSLLPSLTPDDIPF